MNLAQLRGFSPLSSKMQGLLDSNHLKVAEFCFPQEISFTYERGGYCTHIDHIAISQSLKQVMIDCKIVPPSFENLSPHMPIVASFDISIHENIKRAINTEVLTPRPDRLRWDCKKLNEVYRSLLSRYLLSAPASLNEQRCRLPK